MVVLPSERHPVLIVDAITVPSGLVFPSSVPIDFRPERNVGACPRSHGDSIRAEAHDGDASGHEMAPSDRGVDRPVGRDVFDTERRRACERSAESGRRRQELGTLPQERIWGSTGARTSTATGHRSGRSSAAAATVGSRRAAPAPDRIFPWFSNSMQPARVGLRVQSTEGGTRTGPAITVANYDVTKDGRHGQGRHGGRTLRVNSALALYAGGRARVSEVNRRLKFSGPPPTIARTATV